MNCCERTLDVGLEAFSVGERVFHQKFGNGNVTAVYGNKLTTCFDKGAWSVEDRRERPIDPAIHVC